MIGYFFSDAFFAAIAAIGFAAISNPPKKSFFFCALIAAVGHSIRFLLLSPLVGLSIIPASAIASFVIGLLAVMLSPCAKIPAETFLFPSLLPMIPGVYAYKAFAALAMCLLHTSESEFIHYSFLFSSNALVCLFIIIGMVAGGTLPIFLLKRIAFTATR